MLLPQTRTVHRDTRRSQVSRMENVRAADNDAVAGTVGGAALKRPSPNALPRKQGALRSRFERYLLRQILESLGVGTGGGNRDSRPSPIWRLRLSAPSAS